MLKLLLPILLLPLLSCNITKPQVQENTYKSSTIKEELKDTLVNIASDKSQAIYTFKIMNDSTLSITDTLSKTTGNYIHAPTLKIKNNMLILEAKAPEHQLKIVYKNIYRTDTVQTLKTIYTTTNKLNSWQAFHYWTGLVLWSLFTLFVLLYLLLFILKKKTIL